MIPINTPPPINTPVMINYMGKEMLGMVIQDGRDTCWVYSTGNIFIQDGKIIHEHEYCLDDPLGWMPVFPINRNITQDEVEILRRQAYIDNLPDFFCSNPLCGYERCSEQCSRCRDDE